MSEALVHELARSGWTCDSGSSSDLAGWAGHDSTTCLLIEASDPDLPGLRSEFPALALVAIVPDENISTWCDALTTGLDGVVSDSASAEEVQLSVEGACAGRPAVPIDVARNLARALETSLPDTLDLTGTQVSVMIAIASGATVREVSRQLGYSEREIYRILKDVYLGLGVTNRAQAIARAGALGLVEVG